MDKVQEKLIVALDRATCELRFRTTEMQNMASSLQARANEADRVALRAANELAEMVKLVGPTTVGDGAALEIQKALVREQFVMLKVLNSGQCTPLEKDLLSSEVNGIGKAMTIVNDVLAKYGIKVD